MKVFINYRRDDSAPYARLLFNALSTHWPDDIFVDIDNIEFGDDFVEVLEKTLAQCQVMLVLIGKNWLNSVGTDGLKRLDKSDDYVRLEIATGLKRNLRMIPVLIDGVQMPTETQLPHDLAMLSRRQAVELSYKRFDQDAAVLTSAIKRAIGSMTLTPTAATSSTKPVEPVDSKQPRDDLREAVTVPPFPATPSAHKGDHAKQTFFNNRTLLLIGVGISAVAFVFLVVISNPRTTPPAPSPTPSKTSGSEPSQSTDPPPPISPRTTSIDSELVRKIIVMSPTVTRGDVLSVKVLTQSSKVRVFAIFDETQGQPTRVDAKYDPKEGGVYINHQIPQDAVLGPHQARIIVQEMSSSKEEQRVVDYKVM